MNKRENASWREYILSTWNTIRTFPLRIAQNVENLKLRKSAPGNSISFSLISFVTRGGGQVNAKRTGNNRKTCFRFFSRQRCEGAKKNARILLNNICITIWNYCFFIRSRNLNFYAREFLNLVLEAVVDLEKKLLFN